MSVYVTRGLLHTPVTANQTTAASLICGLVAVYLLGLGMNIPAALIFIIAYILDNCDGEIARAKDQCSEFGMRFDTFVDWIVNSGFFFGLGFGTSRVFDDPIWLWLGVAGFVGGTINYLLSIFLDFKDAQNALNSPESASVEKSVTPESAFEWLIFCFRELARADFCFLVLLLALADVLWVLLPAGAIGAQVYWILQLYKKARSFHV